MKSIFFIIIFSFNLTATSAQCESNYPPAAMSNGQIPNIHSSIYFVDGPYAGFDPCNSTVDIRVNGKSDTFVIVLHGSAGSDRNQLNVAKRFQDEGYSVLMFDAFKMNKLSKDYNFWMWTVHTSSHQRMMYFSSVAAIQWLKKNHPERSKKIIFYGNSLGATTALNVAATEGLDPLVMVIADAPASYGIGLPDNLLVPVYILYGLQDNYGGGWPADELLWKRKAPCLWNAPIQNTPLGNAANCNYSIYAQGANIKTILAKRSPSVEEYVDDQKKKGAMISINLFDGAAHAIFRGTDIESETLVSASGVKFYKSLGSKPGVADKVFQEMLAAIKHTTNP